MAASRCVVVNRGAQAQLNAALLGHLSGLGLGAEVCTSVDALAAVLDEYCSNSSGASLCVLVSVEDGASVSCLLQKLSWPTFTRRPRVILLSSLSTWGGAAYADPIADAKSQFLSRLPSSNAVEAYSLENALYSLATAATQSGLEVAILPLGLVFGGGGWDLETFFRDVWNCDSGTTAPVVIKVNSIKNGTNKVPMVHISDVLAIVAELVQKPELAAFSVIPLTDGSTATVGELLAQVSRKVNGPGASLSFMTQAELADAIVNSTQDIPDVLRWNLDLSFLTTSSDDGRERRNLVDSLESIWAEFLDAHALKPLSILVAGNPKSGKTEVSSLIAAKLKTEHITTIKAVSHVLKFDSFQEADAGLAVRGEIMAIVEAKAAEGKKPPPKKGEVEAPVAIEPASVEVTDSLCASIPADVIRRCVATTVQTNSACIRRGFVLDIWEGGSIKTAEDLHLALGGAAAAAAVAVAAATETSSLAEGGDGAVATEQPAEAPPLRVPELVLELQCADVIVVQRYLVTLGVPEGGLAKSSKENQAAVKALETTLATYSATVKPVEPKLDEYGEPIAPQFANSHEMIQEVERANESSVMRIDASTCVNDDVSSQVCIRLLEQRMGNIGWLPDLSLPTQPPAATDDDAVVVDTTLNVTEELSSQEAAPELPAFKRLQDRSITDLNSAIDALSVESKKALISQCDELQEYLGHNVMPFLAKGMIRIAREKPEDAVAFMAQFLLEEGKALEDAAREKALANFNSVLAAAREEESKLMS